MAVLAKGCPDVSFMFLADQCPSPPMRARSYGGGRSLRQILGAAVCSVALIAATVIPSAKAGAPVKIVALGDSLTAGLGLPEKDGFVARVQAALTAKGVAAVSYTHLDVYKRQDIRGATATAARDACRTSV